MSVVEFSIRWLVLFACLVDAMIVSSNWFCGRFYQGRSASTFVVEPNIWCLLLPASRADSMFIRVRHGDITPERGKRANLARFSRIRLPHWQKVRLIEGLMIDWAAMSSMDHYSGNIRALSNAIPALP
jgi:hypothetical protein